MLEENLFYHIVWVIHCSRVSARMIKYKVKSEQTIWLDQAGRFEIAQYLVSIIKDDGLIVLAVNVLVDHVHIILFCKPEARDNIVRKLKGKSTQMYKIARNFGETGSHLWGQKYGWIVIEDEEWLFAAIEYVENNHLKHGLPENYELRHLIEENIVSYYDIFNETI